METNKISHHINNAISDNLKALAQLFPSAVKDGQLDVEALKEELGEFEEVGAEKYELTWSGKQTAKKLAQEDVYNRTLKYVAEGSKNPATTENLYIEGDNLEVLKLLRQNYYGSIKMIYIDPPYNTGNDFVYNDKFTMDKKSSDIAEGVTDEDGNPLQKNQQSSNRYHANWLNMMYPRLKIAKDLLTDDGIIFISIDDNEVHNLRKICDSSEIFGESNFVATIVWQKKYAATNDSKGFSTTHDYIIAYQKSSKFNRNLLPRTKEQNKPYKNDDGDGKGLWRSDNLLVKSFSQSGVYPIQNPNTKIEYYPPEGSCWRASRATMQLWLSENRIFFGKDGKGAPQLKRYLNEVQQGRVPITWWGFEEVGHNDAANKEVSTLFGSKTPFDTPKPVSLLKQILMIASNHNDIILDFFSGSATTAHAVMQLNAEDGGNRKFIMVQYPELTDEKSEAHKAGYKNICEIGKERIRRAGDKILADNKDKDGIENLDIGFKVFRTDDTNIKWNLLETMGQLTMADVTYTPDLVDFVTGAKDIDIVYEIMLRQKDVPLSESMEVLSDIGERTYLYASSYLVCLETEITTELVEKLAALDPLPIKFVFRDSAFKDDISLKDETFRRLKSLVERNSGEMKKTYTVEFI